MRKQDAKASLRQQNLCSETGPQLIFAFDDFDGEKKISSSSSRRVSNQIAQRR